MSKKILLKNFSQLDYASKLADIAVIASPNYSFISPSLKAIELNFVQYSPSLDLFIVNEVVFLNILF